MVSEKEYTLFDEVELKKAHPCANRSRRFQILRLGADVKFVCLECGSMLVVSRDSFNHSIKKILAHHDKPLVKYEPLS